MATRRGFLFCRVFLSSSSGTLRSMTIKRHGHLCPTRVTSLQMAMYPGLYIGLRQHVQRSTQPSPQKHQSHVIYGAPDQITSVFFRCPGVLSVLSRISSAINSVPPNKSIYLCFYKNHICFFLSVLKKTKHTAPIQYVWRHKDFKTQREDHAATRLTRL